MPCSACSTCHTNNNGVRSTPQPVSTTTATPNPTASPLRVTVTVNQNANQSAWGNNPGGDRGLWLQDTIEQRQAWTHDQDRPDHGELDAAAVQLGYADDGGRPRGPRGHPRGQMDYGPAHLPEAFTNVGFVESEGSSASTTGTTRVRSSTRRTAGPRPS